MSAPRKDPNTTARERLAEIARTAWEAAQAKWAEQEKEAS
jgi:hypothetical protein